MRSATVLVLGLVIALGGCGGGGGEDPCVTADDCEGGMRCVNGMCLPDDVDAGRDAGRDAGTDSGVDAGQDTGQDTGQDAPDVGPDTFDAGPIDCLGDNPPPVVLYTFDRDDGALIHDRAPAAPLVELTTTGFTFADGAGTVTDGQAISPAGQAAELVDAVTAEGGLTIEAWVLPENLVREEEPPERIVTISRDSGTRNVTLGLEDGMAMGRLRTTGTYGNGVSCDLPRPPDAGFISAEFFGPMLRSSGDPVQVVLSFQNGRTPRLFVDGVEAVLDYECDPGTLDSWDPVDMHVVLGNEVVGGRQFEGAYHRVAIYARPMSAGEVACWFGAGPEHPVLL